MSHEIFTTQVVIPCYNEGPNLSKLISDCISVSELSQNRVSFILVNNGSTDNTKEIFSQSGVERNRVTFLNLETNRGYGGGILAGLSKCDADFVGWTHADLQTPLTDILEAIKRQYVGDEFIKGSRVNREYGEQFFSTCMSIFESLLFGKKLREINAQPTIFPHSSLAFFDQAPLDFSLDLFAILIAKKAKMRIVRFDVEYLPRQFGASKWNFGFKSKLKFIIRTMKFSLQLRWTFRANH